MAFDKKIYPSYCDSCFLESVRDKQKLNLRMILKVSELTDEIKQTMHYIGNCWFNLKQLVHGLHAIYRIFYKLLKMYGSKDMAQKCDYHHLVYGPRKIEENMNIFKHLCNFVSIQVAILRSQVVFSLKVKFHDTVSRLLFRINKFFHTILWNYKSSSEVYRNGVPIKYQWM